ncbi:rRNA-processing protein Fcf1/Utp23 protein [Raphanus sativus]|nr:rRNA-processing protein Fcf1/Utp23 protein [Raphanus sativus]
MVISTTPFIISNLSAIKLSPSLCLGFYLGRYLRVGLQCLVSPTKRIEALQGGVLNPIKKGLTELPRNVPNVPSGMFFSHNTNMVPPYRVLVDTNFINFSIQNKIDIENGMMFCLNAKCTPCITDCIMAELEKIAKDPCFERLPCVHKGTYADDCLVDRVTQVKCMLPLALAELCIPDSF